MKKTCTACEVEKPESAFRKFGRGRKKICVECEQGAQPGAQDETDEETATAAEGQVLVRIEPSMGARLKISGRLLEIEQDRVGEDRELYTHTVTLYPHEARRLIEFIEEQLLRSAEAA